MKMADDVFTAAKMTTDQFEAAFLKWLKANNSTPPARRPIMPLNPPPLAFPEVCQVRILSRLLPARSQPYCSRLVPAVTPADDPPASPISFKKITIDKIFRSEGSCAADVNKDGKMDVIVGDFPVRGTGLEDSSAAETARRGAGATREGCQRRGRGG